MLHKPLPEITSTSWSIWLILSFPHQTHLSLLKALPEIARVEVLFQYKHCRAGGRGGLQGCKADCMIFLLDGATVHCPLGSFSHDGHGWTETQRTCVACTYPCLSPACTSHLFLLHQAQWGLFSSSLSWLSGCARMQHCYATLKELAALHPDAATAFPGWRRDLLVFGKALQGRSEALMGLG